MLSWLRAALPEDTLGIVLVGLFFCWLVGYLFEQMTERDEARRERARERFLGRDAK